LLDPQLREYLPGSSNIVRFQQRFTLGDHEHDADTSIVQFVFGPTPANLDELPQRSSLERAVVGHLKAGRHWKGRSGWFRL
jgi:GNAT-like C-terminal domain